MASKRASGSLESEVLACLWAAGGPLTPAQVAEDLGGGLAYTTVQTVLARLHAKGAVRRTVAGRAHAYTPLLDDAGLAAHRMQQLLDVGRDRGAVLAQFLDTLTPADEAVLADLLTRRDRAGKRR